MHGLTHRAGKDLGKKGTKKPGDGQYLTFWKRKWSPSTEAGKEWLERLRKDAVFKKEEVKRYQAPQRSGRTRTEECLLGLAIRQPVGTLARVVSVEHRRVGRNQSSLVIQGAELLAS